MRTMTSRGPNGRSGGAWLLVGATLLASMGVMTTACTPEVEEVGTMTLDLTATGVSGAEYRLRNGVFEITPFSSDEVTVVSTEDDLDAETIELELPPDMYSVFLQPGHYLEQVGDIGAGGGAGGSGFSNIGELKRFSDLVDFREQHPTRKVVVNPARAQSSPSPLAEPQIVESELVSENPAIVPVYSDQQTDVDFVFAIEPGASGDDGELSIGISVIEPGSSGECEADAFEPNDSPEEASEVELEPPIEATACEFDEDFYLFDSPAAEGELLRVIVEFQHADGDIDAILVDDEGDIVADGVSVTNDEVLETVSNGGQYLLYVYPYDGEASYSVRAEVDVAVLSDCCTTSNLPGCTEPEVDQCVCDIDPYCCEVEFDSICSQISLNECGGSCALGEGSCCETSDEPGCEDQEVMDCICAIDSQCCTDSYDEWCVQEAAAECGLSCDTPDPDSDCCSPGDNPSCTDANVAECTCEIDPICCAAPFDENCVDIATAFCGAACGGE